MGKQYLYLDKGWYCSSAAVDSRLCSQFKTEHCLKVCPARKPKLRVCGCGNKVDLYQTRGGRWQIICANCEKGTRYYESKDILVHVWNKKTRKSRTITTSIAVTEPVEMSAVKKMS